MKKILYYIFFTSYSFFVVYFLMMFGMYVYTKYFNEGLSCQIHYFENNNFGKEEGLITKFKQKEKIIGNYHVSLESEILNLNNYGKYFEIISKTDLNLNLPILLKSCLFFEYKQLKNGKYSIDLISSGQCLTEGFIHGIFKFFGI